MRNVWPSEVVAPISVTSCSAIRSAASKSAARSPSYTNSTSMSEAYDSSAPPSLPMPITVNGTGGSRPTSATSRQASASAVSSRSVDFERCETEQVACRDPQQLAPLEPAQSLAVALRCSPRHSSVSSASSTSSARVLLGRHQVVVAERVDELRVTTERVTDHSARSEERARALGGARRVAERAWRANDERAGPSASRRSCRSPRSGSGVSESHSRITGSSCCISFERRVRPNGELADRGAGPLDVGEAERGQPLLGRARRQGPGAGEGVEQGREEQPLVDRSHRGLVRAVVGFERFERAPVRLIAVAEDARETRAGALVGRDGVRLLLVVELQSMLDGTEEPVRVVESRRVGGFDVSRRRERASASSVFGLRTDSS